MKSKVSLVTYKNSPDSLKDAIFKCDGFSELNSNSRVLVKPNLVAWDDRYPIIPYGVFTTTRLVEDLVICLKDHGCGKIEIGEGSVVFQKGVGTMRAFEMLGYRKLKKRYGINLIDFNMSESVDYKFHDNLKLQIAKEAIEANFFINFPVLKTHGVTKVSLGLKNLKGCLKLASKKLCHHPELKLEYIFSFIADFIKPSLTIIDGIYALEKGAFQYGNAHRKNIVVASKDILAADLVAASSIGYKPKDIEHFCIYADRNSRSLSLLDYNIRGENLKNHIQKLEWDWKWTDDNTGPGIFRKLGISGIALPKYDDTLCSGCSLIANMLNILVISAYKGEPLPKVEILNGKKMQARPGYEKTILLGNCIIKANKNNPNIKEAVYIKGCPPETEDVVETLKSIGLDINEKAYYKYQKKQSEKYRDKEGYTWDFYRA